MKENIIELVTIMLSYSKIYSHPKKPLEYHLTNVALNSKNIAESLYINNSDPIPQISFLIGLCHDFAKSTSFFQEYLLNDKKTKKSQHGFLSAVFGFYVVKQYLLKNNINTSLNFSILSYLVILHHHGDLNNIDGTNADLNKVREKLKLGKEQIDDIAKLIEKENLTLKSFYLDHDIKITDFIDNYFKIVEEIEDELDDMCFEKNLNNYLYLLLLYSILLDSDKIDASETKIFKRINIPQNIVDNFKNQNFISESSEINKIRDDSYNEVKKNMLSTNLNKRIFSIELPTGTGKTFNALSAALTLKNRINNEYYFNPRIIYSLPFLSIIDQNEKVIYNILKSNGIEGSNTLLKHNYLSNMSYKVKNEKELNLNNARILIEGWYSEIIITTFMQLFHSLITNKNRSIRKFHNIINSIIILDEVQSIPYEYWEITNTLLKKIAYEFNTWIILITATQPLIFEENVEITPLIDNKEKYYESIDRINYNFNLKPQTIGLFNEKIINDIIKNNEKDIMVILNTKNSCKGVYNYIKNYFSDLGEDIEINKENGIVNIGNHSKLIYMATDIIPKHRLKKIDTIKNSKKRKVIITTQLVEAGVDISVDIIYRDLAPLDSIIQSAGRCNRNFSDEKGIVNVISLTNDEGRFFHRYVYSSILINITKEVIGNKKTCSESEFNFKSSKEYYAKIHEYGSQNKSKNIVKILEDLDLREISHNFKLINSDIETIAVFIELDDESKHLWDIFKELNDIKNRFEKRDKFLNIKSNFFNYVISVDYKKIGTSNIENDWMAYVSKEDVGRKYDIETGFISHEDEEVFII